MTAFPPRTDIRRHTHRTTVSWQEATYAPQQTEPLFDHLVGAQLEFAADGEAERLRGLEIDGELELGRLLDGKIARLRALANRRRQRGPWKRSK
jgi:hypothetical protein